MRLSFTRGAVSVADSFVSLGRAPSYGHVTGHLPVEEPGVISGLGVLVYKATINTCGRFFCEYKNIHLSFLLGKHLGGDLWIEWQESVCLFVYLECEHI